MAALAVGAYGGHLPADGRLFADAAGLVCLCHLVQHLARTGAFEPLAQGAVGVDLFVADQTLVRITDSIQATTTALDPLTRKDHAKRHAHENREHEREGKGKGGHRGDLGRQATVGRAGGGRETRTVRRAVDEQDGDVMGLSDL